MCLVLKMKLLSKEKFAKYIRGPFTVLIFLFVFGGGVGSVPLPLPSISVCQEMYFFLLTRHQSSILGQDGELTQNKEHLEHMNHLCDKSDLFRKQLHYA